LLDFVFNLSKIGFAYLDFDGSISPLVFKSSRLESIEEPNLLGIFLQMNRRVSFTDSEIFSEVISFSNLG